MHFKARGTLGHVSPNPGRCKWQRVGLATEYYETKKTKRIRATLRDNLIDNNKYRPHVGKKQLRKAAERAEFMAFCAALDAVTHVEIVMPDGSIVEHPINEAA